MFKRLFHRQSHSAALLDASRAGVERVREALPELSLSDVFADLAARTGVDLQEVAERVLDRLGDAVALAESEASGLADTETAHQLRALAGRAAGRATELAYRSGAERFFDAMPRRRRRSNTGLILLSAGLGLAAGSVLAYLLLSRTAQLRRGQRAPSTTEGPTVPGPETIVPAVGAHRVEAQPVASPTSPLDQPIARLRARLHAATRAAHAAESETERRLWHEYRNEPTMLPELPASPQWQPPADRR